MNEARIRARLAEMPPALQLLAERMAMEIGALSPPPGTVRREASFSIADTPGSMNENELRSHWKPSHAHKKLWQGWFMRAIDGLGLPRPIPRVGPLWAHVTLRFPVRRERDTVDNWLYPVAKRLGDALTGRPARDRAMDVDHRRYVAGWLDRDNAKAWLLTLEIDDELGPPRVTVRFVWDEPIETGSPRPAVAAPSVC